MSLADVVYRDPFERPQEVPAQSRMAEVLRELLPVEKRKAAVMVVNPATDPINVIGSKVVDGCTLCGAAVHVAPSGQAYLAEHPDGVALVCLAHVLERLKADARAKR